MFELVDAIEIDAAGAIARGRASVPAEHPMLRDHFPGHPLLPASWVIELAAQIAGPLAEEVMEQRGHGGWALLVLVQRAKMLVPVSLPARLSFDAALTEVRERIAILRTTVRVETNKVADVGLSMLVTEPRPEHEEAARQRHERLARWKAAW